MKTSAKQIAFGGMIAAVALVILCMGGLVSVATYVGPVLCMLALQLVLKTCGRRIAWAWYGAVAFLALILCPDKESAAVFLFLGYYPVVKPTLDKYKFSWLWKGILFNVAILAMYAILTTILGMDEITREFTQLGNAMLAFLLLLGNVTFFLLDRLLEKGGKRK